VIYAPVGCNKCNDGYKGRVGIFQVMPVSETIGRIIMEGGNAMQIAAEAEKEGIWDLRRAGTGEGQERHHQPRRNQPCHHRLDRHGFSTR
jgi:type II secretory ATPase GspE/PulE/Tfp pilus assembly ATPase PilB-like protein